jgi:hypothetical protein
MTAGESLEASQAALNEIAASMINDSPGDRELVARARDALRQHSWARGFPFEDVPPPHRDELTPGGRREIAVLATQGVQAALRANAARAKAVAVSLKHMTPDDARRLMRQPGFKASQPAVVYLITHTAYKAAKVGVGDTPGTRLAEHSRRGWQLVAMFQVTAQTAIEIEAGVLHWWRSELGLPPHLVRDQMPQGGWTETAALNSIDLAATVMRICQLAVPAPGPVNPAVI